MISKTRVLLCVFPLTLLVTPLDAEETFHVSESTQSVLKARDAIREGRKSGKIPADSQLTVVIEPGVYRIDEPLLFGAEDHGVTYRAKEPGTVSFRGGQTLSSGKFEKVSDPSILERLPKSMHDKVFVYDLSGILPEELPAYPDSYRGTPPAPWLYVDGELMTLARWPNRDAANEGWATFSEVIDNGLPDPKSNDPAQRKSHPGTFVFDDDRPRRWDIEGGAWLLGYWTHDWSDEVIRIANYDSSQKAIHLAASHSYGLKGGTWGASERRFFAQNLLEELDSPSEWYIDREAKKLYIYPIKPLSESSVVLATQSTPLVQIESTNGVKLEGITFEYTHGDSLTIKGSRNITIVGCQFSNIAGTGISASGEEITIRSCDLFHLGRGGISIAGGDRKTLTASKNLVTNNHIHDYGIFQRTYAAGISVSGCGTTVSHNLIHDAPHNAIKYSGNEHLFEKNEVHHVVMETGDSGAFYTGRDWTSQGNVLRHNYIHHLGDYESDSTHTMGIYLDDCDSGDTLEGNVLYKVGRAFLIGGGRDNPIRNNLIIDCPIGIHLDSRGMSWKQWNNPEYAGWNLEEKAEKLNYKSPPWSEKYPSLARIMSDSPREPLHTTIESNIFINSSKSAASFNSTTTKILPKLKVEDNLVLQKVALTDEEKAKKPKGFAYEKMPEDLSFVDFDTGNFTLKEDSFLLKKRPELQKIPFEEIGLKVNDVRKSLPARAGNR